MCSRQPSFGNKIEIIYAEIESHYSFKYLGATVNPNYVIEEIKERIPAGNRVYCIKELFVSKLLSRNTRLRL
jgi:hypothetical protein